MLGRVTSLVQLASFLLQTEIDSNLPVPYAMPKYPNSRLRPGSAVAVKAHLESGGTAESTGILSQVDDLHKDSSDLLQARGRELSLIKSQEDTGAPVSQLQWLPPGNTAVDQAEESRDDSESSVIVRLSNPLDSEFTIETSDSLSENSSSRDRGSGLTLYPANSSGYSNAGQTEPTSRTASGQETDKSSTALHKPECVPCFKLPITE